MQGSARSDDARAIEWSASTEVGEFGGLAYSPRKAGAPATPVLHVQASLGRRSRCALAASRRQGRATQHTAREEFWPTVAIKGGPACRPRLARLSLRTPVDHAARQGRHRSLQPPRARALPRASVGQNRGVPATTLGIVHSAHSAFALVLGSSFQTRREPARHVVERHPSDPTAMVRGLMLDREGQKCGCRKAQGARTGFRSDDSAVRSAPGGPTGPGASECPAKPPPPDHPAW
jgi:hypothetical protein